MDDSAFRELIALLHRNHFLSEFTFTKNEFTPKGGSEEEFADGVIWLENEMLVFQIKERNASKIGDIESEKKWFFNKILNIAKKQIKKTISYFKSNQDITIKNIRGHSFNLKTNENIKFHKIIIYKHATWKAIALKKYISKKVGFIHIFDYPDYVLVCEILDTPTEILEYLAFRDELLTKYNIDISSEKSLLGAYLKYANLSEFRKLLPEGKQFEEIILELETVVERLIKNKSDYYIEHILESFYERLYTPQKDNTQYYKILIELVKMHRSERKHFKERWDKCLIDLLGKDEEKPYRMIVRKSDCGFIFIPLLKIYCENRFSILQKYTMLSKYDLKIDKQIGISFCKTDKTVFIDYGYSESEWKPDKQLEKILKDKDFFRPMKKRYIQRYKFN